LADEDPPASGGRAFSVRVVSRAGGGTCFVPSANPLSLKQLRESLPASRLQPSLTKAYQLIKKTAILKRDQQTTCTKIMYRWLQVTASVEVTMAGLEVVTAVVGSKE